MSIRISLISPSFKRPQRCTSTFQEWINKADTPSEIEYIVALDSVDSTVAEYQSRLSQTTEINKVARFEISVGNSTSGVQAMNRGAELTTPTSELLVGVADDLGCFLHWDTELFKVLKGVNNLEEPRLIWPGGVNGGPDGTVLTCYFANRAFYTRVGYVLNEEYSSMFADNEFMEVGKLLNCIVHAPHLVFYNYHPLHGSAVWDETYARRFTQQEYDRGREIFLRRQAKNFDLPQR
jgi:hypothetical protein